MSRFNDYEDDSEYAALNDGRWWNNVKQIFAGKKGQKILNEFEQALMVMPVKRLIDDDICKEEYVFDELGNAEPTGQYSVCAIGAYAVYKGKSYEELSNIISKLSYHQWYVTCPKCHGNCNICGLIQYVHNWQPYRIPVLHEFKSTCNECSGFGKIWPDQLREIPEKSESGEEETVELGVSIGMQRTLAWYIAQMNDEDFSYMTPERRYEATLKWVRQVIHAP